MVCEVSYSGSLRLAVRGKFTERLTENAERDASRRFAFTAFPAKGLVRTARELYDHSKDPHEWTNQIDNKAYAADLLILRTKVPALKDMAPKLKSGRDKGDD